MLAASKTYTSEKSYRFKNLTAPKKSYRSKNLIACKSLNTSHSYCFKNLTPSKSASKLSKYWVSVSLTEQMLVAGLENRDLERIEGGLHLWGICTCFTECTISRAHLYMVRSYYSSWIRLTENCVKSKQKMKLDLYCLLIEWPINIQQGICWPIIYYCVSGVSTS